MSIYEFNFSVHYCLLRVLCMYVCLFSLLMRLGMTFVRRPQYMWALVGKIAAPEEKNVQNGQVNFKVVMLC